MHWDCILFFRSVLSLFGVRSLWRHHVSRLVCRRQKGCRKCVLATTILSFVCLSLSSCPFDHHARSLARSLAADASCIPHVCLANVRSLYLILYQSSGFQVIIADTEDEAGPSCAATRCSGRLFLNSYTVKHLIPPCAAATETLIPSHFSWYVKHNLYT